MAIFVVTHMANQLMALVSVAAHIRFMEQARLVYRQPLVEAGLLLFVALQALSGLWLVRTGWKSGRPWIELLQVASGVYLALFLLIHVAAVLFGRAVFGLDTNIHFAAAGLHIAPFRFILGPYYFLAVLALFTHFGCAVSWHVGPSLRVRACVVVMALLVGAGVSILILAALLGKIYSYEVPHEYKYPYQIQQTS